MSKQAMAHDDIRDLEVTKNIRGFMHRLNEIGQAFVDFASEAPGLVVDVGAAYGVATIPILNKHIKVVACDMEEAHLLELKKRIDAELLSYFEAKVGSFPDNLVFKKNSVGAILFSHILHFLSPDELDRGFLKLSDWVAPNGKVFIVLYAPYTAIMKDFIPIYEKRMKQGIKWPYWVENNVRDFFVGPKEIADNLPSTMNYLDLPELSRALEMQHFVIEKADYLNAKINHIPQGALLDGREWIGVIARKM